MRVNINWEILKQLLKDLRKRKEGIKLYRKIIDIGINVGWYDHIYAGTHFGIRRRLVK
jgi:hypothetical protein